jgi:hypothetical protein
MKIIASLYSCSHQALHSEPELSVHSGQKASFLKSACLTLNYISGQMRLNVVYASGEYRKLNFFSLYS